MELYHFSEEPDIKVFEPRTLSTDKPGEAAKVWTIDEFHAPHYYLPRECPRVCVWPKEDTTEADLDAFFGMSRTNRLVAIESGWYDRVNQGAIYRYTFDPKDFVLYEPNAGYYIATRTVRPLKVTQIRNLPEALLSEGIELRVTPSLMPIKERLLKSTLNFSMIRLRNARELHEFE